MTQKQITTSRSSEIKPPFWRVRRRDEPGRWLRTFDTEAEARAFAREHAIAYCVDMWMQRVGDLPPPVIEEEF
jgi:hypothetical protein